MNTMKNTNIIIGTPLICGPLGRISLTSFAGCGLGHGGVSDEEKQGVPALAAEPRY
jgi:hypothetical protein